MTLSSDTVSSFAARLGRDPMNHRRLLPELRACYRENGGFPMLRHPLVYQVPFFSWKIANTVFREATREVERLTRTGRFRAALVLYQPPYRLEVVERWEMEARLLDRELYRALLTDAWLQTENAHEYGNHRILRLFERAGFTTDREDARGKEFLLPWGSSTVYHGVEAGSRNKLGVSWTTDVDVARWFAWRYGKPRAVWRGTVNHADALAWFESRGESEIVCNPRKLEDLGPFERPALPPAARTAPPKGVLRDGLAAENQG